MSYLDDSAAQITIFEGSVPWLYRDTVGKVTVGVGLMLPDLATAQALPFNINDMGGETTATTDDITKDWNRVMQMAPSLTANAYHSNGSVYLDPTDITAQLVSVLTIFDADLRQRFSGWTSFPEPAQLALLDMIYNLGPYGVFHGYPSMCGAVDAGNWITAATQCGRRGPSAARNLWTKNQFLIAGGQPPLPS